MYKTTNYQISCDSSIKDAITVINNFPAQIALVTNHSSKLLGTITDGDVRRALLKGLGLDEQVSKIMNKNFHFLSSSFDENQVLKLMKNKSIKQIPILDEFGKPTQLFHINCFDNVKKIENSVIIMAGGKGSRLGELTEKCPKPMLKVNGEPILEIILNQFKDSGFKKFYITVNYLKEKIIRYFGDGKKFGVEIIYIEEDNYLGTAGSLSLVDSNFSSPLIVINGDVLSKVNYNQLLNFHSESRSFATICIREHKLNVPFGVVEVKGNEVIKIKEKPEFNFYVNAGIYVFDKNVFKFLEKNKYCDMPDFLEKLKNHGNTLNGFPIHEYWLDVGKPDSFNQASVDW